MTNNDELKGIVEELCHILWKIWDLWKEIAVDSCFVEGSWTKCPKRRNIRLFVGIAVAREEKSMEGKALEK
jgi:hypothetical protein